MFLVSFVTAVALCAGFQYYTYQGTTAEMKTLTAAPGFQDFQRNYLLVYLLAMFADWLKGPYVYALYDYYGYDTGEIAQLFIVGFMASMIVGTFVGGLADKYGRRTMCIAFSVCYFTAGVTKLFNHFWILMFGRFLSGVATSLLFSTFEAWMVSEHNSRGFDPRLLADTFGKATLGNGIVAVLAGLVASAAADAYGYVAPFIVCLIPLFLVGYICSTTWVENYGDTKVDVMGTFQNAFAAIRQDRKFIYLGAAQSCFEGAMYTFVFMWTPAMTSPENKDLPFGLIFAVFMVCVMLGSSLFSLMVKRGIESIPPIIHFTSAAAAGLTAFAIDDKVIVYSSFLAFEVACGLFFPTYGTLRSIHIPEETRSSVMNFFRIPLNAFVVVLLLKVKFMPVATVFWICMFAHVGSLLFYQLFQMEVNRAKSDPVKAVLSGDDGA